MKQKETEFLKALGGIPQSYIDELTQFQAEHAQSHVTARRKPMQRSDEQRKENSIMVHSTQQTIDKHEKADISVQKLRPVTIGILTALTACVVVAAGFCMSHFKKDPLDVMPAASPKQSETTVSGETEPIPAESSFTETEIVSEVPEDTPAVDADDSTVGEAFTVFSFYGDNSETGGIPEIPENGAMLFTSMDELRPLMERATNTDLPVKALHDTESCFNSGKNILVIKNDWIVDSFDSMLRSLYVTADGYLHADVLSYINENRDPGLPPSIISKNYLLVAVPDSLSEISGSAVQQTLFVSDNPTGEGDDPFRNEMIAYYGSVSLKRLAHNEADYIFPEFTYEMYAEDEQMDDDSSWMLGSMLVNMNGAGLPQQIADHAIEIIEPNMTQLHENTLVGINNVSGGAAPYISVYDTAGGTARRLVYPEQRYENTLHGGMRVTLLSSSALADTAEMQEPTENPSDSDSALPHTDGHASYLSIVNNP